MKKICGICGREIDTEEDHRNCVIRDYAQAVNDMDQEIKELQKLLEKYL